MTLLLLSESGGIMAATALFQHQFSRSAELRRKVLELRQAVFHRQHGLGVVDVETRGELQFRQRRGVNIDEPHLRVVGHDVAAAFLAILPLAVRRLLVGGDKLGSFGDAHGAGLPQREGVDRRSRPRTARSTVAVTHALRRARRFELDRPAETLTAISRHFHLLRFDKRRLERTRRAALLTPIARQPRRSTTGLALAYSPSLWPALGTSVQPRAANCAVAFSLARPVIHICPLPPAPATSASSGGDQ